MKRKTIKYQNSKNQDFSDVSVSPGKLQANYPFVHKNIFYRAFSTSLYHFAVTILFGFEKLIHHTKIENRQVIYKLKDTGYFIYSNHTTISDGYMHQVMTNRHKKRTYVVSMQDTFCCNKVFRTLLDMLGGIPIPSDLKNGRNFLKCIKYRLEQKACIVIYPEATIWPYYTGQRPTKKGAFKYPRTFNVPVVFACTTFRKPKGLFKNLKKPRIVVYLSEPIYPSRNGTEKIDENRLKELYQEFIEDRSSIKENYAFYDYVAEDLDKEYLNNSTINDLIDNYNENKNMDK